MDKEQFKDIQGFEGLYKIGNHGSLLSCWGGSWRKRSNTNKKGWYLTVILKDRDGMRHTRRIHRLVYEAFVGSIPEGYHVHHKDENMQNNSVDNLVAITEREHHAIHAATNPNIYEGMRQYNKYIKTKPILQYSMEGVLLGIYNSANDAGRKTGVCSRNILQVANKTEYKPGKTRKQAGGYIWKTME